MKERDAQIAYYFFEKHKAQADIGRMYNLRRQRIHQIINKYRPKKVN